MGGLGSRVLAVQGLSRLANRATLALAKGSGLAMASRPSVTNGPETTAVRCEVEVASARAGSLSAVGRVVANGLGVG